MTTSINDLTTPAGTSGLAVEPWSEGEIYAVAANWAQASAPVYAYGQDGWHQTGRQVADYQHRANAALRAVIIEAIAMSEGIASADVDDDDVAAIMAEAVEIESD